MDTIVATISTLVQHKSSYGMSVNESKRKFRETCEAQGAKDADPGLLSRSPVCDLTRVASSW
jgi:hypothetical protein